MILSEQTQIASAALPVTEFRDHLKLGRGFTDDDIQNDGLERMLRAAIATIEARTGKVILRRSFLWTLTAWRGVLREELPRAPVTAITGLRIVDPDGTVNVIDPARYHLEADTHRPHLSTGGRGLPTVPVGGRIEVDFEAGFATSWAAVPADIAQAVMLLAAHYHDNRGVTGQGDLLPEGIAALLQPYRGFRLFGRRF